MTWQHDATSHAREAYPREACGLVVRVGDDEIYHRCENKSGNGDHFILSPQDYADAEERGEIVAVFHSHPDAPCHPSEADKTSCEASGLPWHILALPANVWGCCQPCGFKAPLIGRTFSHGVLDCYALVRDYYAQELGITIPDFDRDDNWWKKGGNLYLDNFAAAGFRKVDEPALHDVILMQVLSNVPNHAAIYLGHNKMLHHLYGRLSCRDIFGGYWLKHKSCYLRHENHA